MFILYLRYSKYPLGIVLVGVGDGPCEDMEKFDDKILTRDSGIT